MPKLKCRCGETTSLIEVPNPHSFYAIPDEKCWSVVKHVEHALKEEHPTDHINAAIVVESILILKCPNCSRLYVYWNDADSPPTVYTQEGENFN